MRWPPLPGEGPRCKDVGNGGDSRSVSFLVTCESSVLSRAILQIHSHYRVQVVHLRQLSGVRRLALSRREHGIYFGSQSLIGRRMLYEKV